MTAEEFAQHCLNARGYVVIGCNMERSIGDVIPLCSIKNDPRFNPSDAKVVVRARADFADCVTQLEMMGLKPLPTGKPFPYFYRCIAE